MLRPAQLSFGLAEGIYFDLYAWAGPRPSNYRVFPSLLACLLDKAIVAYAYGDGSVERSLVSGYSADFTFISMLSR